MRGSESAYFLRSFLIITNPLPPFQLTHLLLSGVCIRWIPHCFSMITLPWIQRFSETCIVHWEPPPNCIIQPGVVPAIPDSSIPLWLKWMAFFLQMIQTKYFYPIWHSAFLNLILGKRGIKRYFVVSNAEINL